MLCFKATLDRPDLVSEHRVGGDAECRIWQANSSGFHPLLFSARMISGGPQRELASGYRLIAEHR
jgi:hypothetical protein